MYAGLLQGFYLGEWFIEPMKGQVSGRDGSRHLPPKAVEVLLCLALQPGELVPREQLLEKVWGEGHGSPESLAHAVSDIRHALDDHVDDPHYIQTLPRRGYRLAVKPILVSENTASIVLGADSAVNVDDIGLFENLKRRGVLETALAYLIVGWLLIQIADIVFAQLHLPTWAATFVTVFVIAGFPISIALSWFLEFRDGRAILDPVTAATSRRRRFSRTYLSVIGALAAASVLVFFYDQQIGLPNGEEETAEQIGIPISANSIAVLPFLNNDGSIETQTFANGLVEDVITGLSRVPGLLVSSRGDAFTLAPNSPSDQVRQRLRVAMYLEGSVEMAGDEVRVTVQLINSADGFHIFSRSFDHPRKDFFDIRDEITSFTVSSLRVTLPDETQELSFASMEAPDLDAYLLYRHGIDESRKPLSPSTIATALEWFDKALAVDPDYAAAHAGKCTVFVDSYRQDKNAEDVQQAETSCARALQLRPNLDVVHTALGDLYTLTGRYDAAEDAYDHALRINPKNVDSFIGLSEVYRLQQRPTDAEDVLKRAIGLQPGNWQPYQGLGIFYYRQGRFDEAAVQFTNVVEIDRNNMRGLSNLASSYMLAGNFAAAAPVYHRSVSVEPTDTTYANLGIMYYYLGQYDLAEEALRSAIKLTPNAHVSWMNLGDILFVAGREEEAYSAYARAKELVAGAIDVNPNNPEAMMDLAWIDAMLGNQALAYENIDRAAALAPDDPYADYVRGLIALHFDDRDAALESIRAATAKGYPTTILKAEPHLVSLRGDPRFRQIVGPDTKGRNQ